jgi:hypothetical protein
MRHPFYMEKLGRKERTKVNHLLSRVIALYLSLTLIIVAGMAIRAHFIPGSDHVRLEARMK